MMQERDDLRGVGRQVAVALHGLVEPHGDLLAVAAELTLARFVLVAVGLVPENFLALDHGMGVVRTAER